MESEHNKITMHNLYDNVKLKRKRKTKRKKLVLIQILYPKMLM